MLIGSEVEAPNWEAEGDCRSCNAPLGERPPKGSRCWARGDHVCGARHGRGVNRCDLRHRDCQRLEAEERAARLGVLPARVNLRSSDVLRGIRQRHRPRPGQMPEWLVLPEFDLGGRRADALALRLWTSRGLHLLAYEIKVDRTDLTNELRNPEKRRPAEEASTEFWFACPVGLMDPAEVPEGCGLIEFGLGPRGGWHWHRAVPAPYRPLSCVPPRLLWGVAWRLRDIEHRLQGRGIVL